MSAECRGFSQVRRCLSEVRLVRPGAIAVAVSGFVAVSPVAAQDVGNSFVSSSLPLVSTAGVNVSVAERGHPEYAPLGLRVGGFTMYPQVALGVGYTDNVYEIDTPKVSDEYFHITPTVRVVSNWSLNSLDFDGGMDVYKFANQGRRNQDGWHVGASGEYDLGSSTSISVQARTQRATEAQTSASSPTATAGQSQFQQTLGEFSLRHEIGAMTGELTYSYSKYTFNDVRLLNGDLLDQKNRDSTTNDGTARLSYALTPSTGVFVQLSYDNTGYSIDLLPGVKNRQSNTIRGLGGVTFDLSNLFRGAIAVGYSRRNYASPLYANISGVTAEARLEYFPTQLTTLTLSGKRVIEDASFLTSGGYFNESVALRVDHELFRNLILNAQAGYEHDRYVGLAGTLNVARFSAGARYSMSREVGFGLLASHDSRSGFSALSGSGYRENRVQLSVILQR